jgi:hypothetical protein
MLCKSCSSSHTENNKIDFAIFGFFYELISNLQSTGPLRKTGKNLLMPRPLKLLKIHKYALAFITQALGNTSPSQQYPSRRGKLRSGRRRQTSERDGRLDSRRDESRSDRIIPLPHPHPYFFCRMWSGADITWMWLRMRIFSDVGYGVESDRVRSGYKLI